ncbi:PorP/SprF family type IX secretion system membrane protein [Algibacter sp.]|uniref:PorP/SprF family type IX secretion system membrane protein n=1 Tax=Algibacter sp. TaxID=1872428 RepID=UPI003C71C7B1
MIKKSSFIKSLILVVFTALLSLEVKAQQEPQFTHYMYNTMSVNPAYAGQRDVLSATALYRTQWVGLDGAPKTMTFGIHSPLSNDRIGLGLNIVRDQLGPATETSVDANLAYTIPLNESGKLKLSFGVKGGMHMLDTDWSKGSSVDGDPVFGQNDINLISPTLGAGLYLHSDNGYLGVAVPNILETNHYDDYQQSIATERFHMYLIGGLVFNLSDNTKLKPAVLVKGVDGSPIIADLSLNALFHDKFTLGVAYRWDDSFSGLIGFQLSPGLLLGYSYDATTTGLRNYNNGTHEVMLRLELQQIGKILSPRFF